MIAADSVASDFQDSVGGRVSMNRTGLVDRQRKTNAAIALSEVSEFFSKSAFTNDSLSPHLREVSEVRHANQITGTLQVLVCRTKQLC